MSKFERKQATINAIVKLYSPVVDVLPGAEYPRGAIPLIGRAPLAGLPGYPKNLPSMNTPPMSVTTG